MKLYFGPMACSMASRIACVEAGLDVTYQEVNLSLSQISETQTPFMQITSKQKVPVLELDDGQRLTESAAVLQYIADHGPNRTLAPPQGDDARYRLQEMLSFIGSEIHKGILYPLFQPDTPTEMKVHIHAEAPIILDQLGQILEGKDWALGNTFTIVDAYLAWALYLIKLAKIDLPPSLKSYGAVLHKRPSVATAFATEMQLWQAQQDQAAPERTAP